LLPVLQFFQFTNSKIFEIFKSFVNKNSTVGVFFGKIIYIFFTATKIMEEELTNDNYSNTEVQVGDCTIDNVEDIRLLSNWIKTKNYFNFSDAKTKFMILSDPRIDYVINYLLKIQSIKVDTDKSTKRNTIYEVVQTELKENNYIHEDSDFDENRSKQNLFTYFR